MTVVYFDSCAFVKLLTVEAGSDLAVQLWDGCEAALSSRLAYPEVCAALAAAVRRGDIETTSRRDEVHQWNAIWATIRPLELTPLVAAHAGRLADRHALSGADAVHLASALAPDDDSVVMATWDRRLGEAARSAGLRIVPANPQ